ncbi:MAG TPA: hypothetical protein PLD47_13130 [Aggregatilineales bacterium]|nr:hypothetical protein [Anaerolineales bacterium]HRE48661.1 hypothetical protein [Aggregatilineales bacterium]
MTTIDPTLSPHTPQPDTQPRRPAGLDDYFDDAPRRGCGNTLLISMVILMMLVMSFAVIGIAGFLGWRDGGTARRATQAVAVAATLDRQATLARTNLDDGQWELAFTRCDYVATLQPLYAEMAACKATAQAALNATATPTPTETPIPTVITSTPTTTPPPAGAFAPEELLTRAQESVRRTDYETAMRWLEALRAVDASYKRGEVEQLLLTVYQALGSQYRFEGRLGEMIVVIEKAFKINALSNTDWGFTVNAAKLYLSARGYLEAGNYPLAAQVFARLMSIAPAFSDDTKTLACKAFASAGDTISAAQYGCR